MSAAIRYVAHVKACKILPLIHFPYVEAVKMSTSTSETGVTYNRYRDKSAEEPRGTRSAREVMPAETDT